MDNNILEGFGVENFRLFKDFVHCKFNNISILTGPNNSGKSSFIKALLLLYSSQSDWHKKTLWGERLDFFKGPHGLSGIKTTLNNPDLGVVFSVQNGDYYYCYEFDNKGGLYYNYKICKNNQLVIQQAGGDLQVCFSRLIEYIESKSELNYTNRETINSLIKALRTYRQSNPDFFNVFLEETENDGLRPRISYDPESMNDLNRNTYFVDYDGFIKNFDIDDADVEQELTINWLLTEIVHADKVSKEVIEYLFPPMNPAFQFMPEVFYFPSNHGSIKRSYLEADTDILKDIIKRHVKINTEYSYGFPWASNDYTEFVDKWIHEFGIGSNLVIQYDEVKGIYFITIDGRSIVDFGLGTAHIISLLIWMSNLRYEHQRDTKFKPLIILEEPETNLHPALQSKLMEFIVELSVQYKYQFIIETHSEYMIRKLQFLSAKKKINPEDSIIYYFNSVDKLPKGEPHLKEIFIEEDGSLSDNFGPGFFDEADNIALELYRLRRNKSRLN